MADVSTAVNLLSLPTEILREVSTLVLTTNHQTTSFCSCNHNKRGLFNKRVRMERPNDLKLVNKRLARVTYGIQPKKTTAVVCSLGCLKVFLAHLKTLKGMGKRFRSIIISERRRLPVDVCRDNKRQLEVTAQGWVENLDKQCGKATKSGGFASSSVELTMSNVNESTSMALLLVQKAVLWKQKK